MKSPTMLVKYLSISMRIY